MFESLKWFKIPYDFVHDSSFSSTRAGQIRELHSSGRQRVPFLCVSLQNKEVRKCWDCRAAAGADVAVVAAGMRLYIW